MRSLLIFLVLILANSCKSQNIENSLDCNCSIKAFTTSIPKESANLCIEKNGFTVVTLNFPFGEENENSIFFFQIKACDEGWLEVDMPLLNNTLWIEPSKLATTSSNNSFSLYSFPNESSNIIYKSTSKEILLINGCQEKWAFVSLELESGKVIKGWIKGSDQCANPFTNCN